MTLKRKIFLTCAAIAMVVCVVLCATAVIQINGFKGSDGTVISVNESSQVAIASDALASLNTERMQNIAKLQGAVIDEILNTYETKVSTMADIASEIYSNPNKYGHIAVYEPKAELDGEMSVQLLHSENITNLNAFRKETGMLGNMAEDICAICDQDDAIGAMYVASESGLTLQVDMVSASKLDADGKALPYEAFDKPWYIGARHAEGPYFNVPAVDDKGREYIICSVPFYANESLAGVVCALVYLDDIGDIVDEYDMGQQGFTSIIGIDDKVIFSSKEEGALSVYDQQGMESLMASEFADHISLARSGENNMVKMNIDDHETYMSFVYIESTGWILVSGVDEAELLSPLLLMSSEIAIDNDDNVARNNQLVLASVKVMVIAMIVMIVVVVIASLLFSRAIVKPISKMTKAVQDIDINNPSIDSSLYSNGELFVLADSIGKMLENEKSVLNEIRQNESEKGKLENEQDVAVRIQTHMLPKEWPAFPERDEFDIFATMNPAKNVGGDFYDYFFVNDNYLAIVIGDVSGNGVDTAVTSAVVNALIKAFTQNGDSPSTVLKRVNQILCKNSGADTFVTVWLGIMDVATGIIVASNAGHEYPALSGAEDKYELDRNTSGPVLGLVPEADYTEYEISMLPGQTMLVYTDGAREAANTSEEAFGSDRILEAVSELESKDSKLVVEKVARRINEFTGTASQTDDITLLAIHRSEG